MSAAALRTHAVKLQGNLYSAQYCNTVAPIHFGFLTRLWIRRDKHSTVFAYAQSVACLPDISAYRDLRARIVMFLLQAMKYPDCGMPLLWRTVSVIFKPPVYHCKERDQGRIRLLFSWLITFVLPP